MPRSIQIMLRTKLRSQHLSSIPLKHNNSLLDASLKGYIHKQQGLGDYRWLWEVCFWFWLKWLIFFCEKEFLGLVDWPTFLKGQFFGGFLISRLFHPANILLTIPHQLLAIPRIQSHAQTFTRLTQIRAKPKLLLLDKRRGLLRRKISIFHF